MFYGTILPIYRRTTLRPSNLSDFYTKGTEQVATGYVIYGSSTMMVYTTSKGVNGFTLNPSIGGYIFRIR